MPAVPLNGRITRRRGRRSCWLCLATSVAMSVRVVARDLKRSERLGRDYASTPQSLRDSSPLQGSELGFAPFKSYLPPQRCHPEQGSGDSRCRIEGSPTCSACGSHVRNAGAFSRWVNGGPLTSGRDGVPPWPANLCRMLLTPFASPVVCIHPPFSR
jgi:hypothetical protein